MAAGQIRPGEFRVVDAKADGMSCVRSTELYPDVVFSSFPNVDAEVTRAVTVALLSMPHQGLDFKWTIANDFLPTYGLLKKLEMVLMSRSLGRSSAYGSSIERRSFCWRVCFLP